MIRYSGIKIETCENVSMNLQRTLFYWQITLKSGRVTVCLRSAPAQVLLPSRPPLSSQVTASGYKPHAIECAPEGMLSSTGARNKVSGG